MNTEDQNRIEALYLQLYDMLFVYAGSSLENSSQAEEAVQDTFVIACQKAGACLNSDNPAGWLVNTLKNVIRNTLRSQSIAKKILSEYCAFHIRELAASDSSPKLELLYGQLSQREEFILLKEIAVDGLSYSEMAQARNITVEACRKRVQRAKEFLQNEIK